MASTNQRGHLTRRLAAALGAVALLSVPAAPRAFERPLGDAYPLATCVVCDQALSSVGKPVIHEHEGRDLRFCSAQCERKFESSPDPFLTKLDEAIAEQQRDDFPIIICPTTPGYQIDNTFFAPYKQVYKLELVCRDEDVERVLHLISVLGKTGEAGDGIVYVSGVDRIVKIRTGEEGPVAVDKMR